MITLPTFDLLAQEAATHLVQGHSIAIVGPPGSGTSAVGGSLLTFLSTAGETAQRFDCTEHAETIARLDALAAGGREDVPDVLILDNLSRLSAEQLTHLGAQAAALRLSLGVKTVMLGAVDLRELQAPLDVDSQLGRHAQLCLPELGSEDLIRVYRSICGSDPRIRAQWGDPILYLVLDWCGNDLNLVRELVGVFYGNWTERIYDESVEEALLDWLSGSRLVRENRVRYLALPSPCIQLMRGLFFGSNIKGNRPEIREETSPYIRRLFFEGFLRRDLLPEYFVPRNLLVYSLIEGELGLAVSPIASFRRFSNARINALLQDMEISLRGMLRRAFLEMGSNAVETQLRNTKIEKELISKPFRNAIQVWAKTNEVENHSKLTSSLNGLMATNEAVFKKDHNLWEKVLSIHLRTRPSNNVPQIEQIAGYLTFSELTGLLQTLSDKIFTNEPRSARAMTHPVKTWPAFMLTVGRLRNEAAHLRNIGFQDLEELLDICRQIRRDQREYCKES